MNCFFKSSPSYKHLKCFGCLCYIYTLPHNRHKFAPRARKYVFLGYPHGIKGYKVLDLDSNSIHFSKDIIFYEHIFLFVSSDNPSTSYLDSFVFPYCVSDASHVSNTPYVFDPPNLPLVDSILATSQPDSTIDPTPFAFNTSHCDYQPMCLYLLLWILLFLPHHLPLINLCLFPHPFPYLP